MENLINFEDFNELNENLYNQKMTSKELEEMESISYKTTRINDVVIWIGNNSKFNKRIIKVSNIPNDKKGEDCFIITLNELKTFGKINKEFITDNILSKIKKFIINNLNTINKYYNVEIEVFDLIEIIRNENNNI